MRATPTLVSMEPPVWRAQPLTNAYACPATEGDAARSVRDPLQLMSTNSSLWLTAHQTRPGSPAPCGPAAAVRIVNSDESLASRSVRAIDEPSASQIIRRISDFCLTCDQVQKSIQERSLLKTKERCRQPPTASWCQLGELMFPFCWDVGMETRSPLGQD